MQKINYKKIRRKYIGIYTIREVSQAKRNRLKKLRQVEKKRSPSTKKSNVTRLSEIINDFIGVERIKYNEFNYNHNPTLGSLYEALTEKSVEKMLHESMNLKLVSGFIYDDKGFKSGEIDRMLVQGSPSRLGFTDKYECHIKDVLVMFEVKKTLTKEAFEDAYEHLAHVSRAYAAYSRPS